jgi:ABC-type branched-subunit amino acid transport system substrate-binding protein
MLIPLRPSSLTAALALALTGLAHADITVGVVLPLTGPASGLGIPIKNAIAIWPKTLAGENLKVITLDDASDPTAGVKATQRLVTEDKVDVIIGSAATPVAIAMADAAAAAGTLQLAASPAALPPGKEQWTMPWCNTCANRVSRPSASWATPMPTASCGSRASPRKRPRLASSWWQPNALPATTPV